MTSTMDFPSGLRQAFDSLLRSSSKCVGKLNISRVSEKRYTQMKNAGIWTAYDSSQLPTVYHGSVFLRGGSVIRLAGPFRLQQFCLTGR